MPRKIPRSWRSTLLWLFLGFFLVVFMFLHQLQVNRTSFPTFRHEYFNYNLNEEEPQDPQQICQLPKIHPFDPSILEYIHPPKPIKCKERQPALTFLDQHNILQFNYTALSLSGYNAKSIKCYFNEIIRPENDDNHVTYGATFPLSLNGSKLRSDFVSVSCQNFAGIPFYNNIHSCIVPVPSIHASKHREGIFNVLIVGIDSMSRLSFIRNLPKTYKFLTADMGSLIFRGMTKVGDNTFPNLAAILTGKPVDDEQLQTSKTETYDKWPCIWKNFSNSGYVTMFAEDRPDIALFNYLRGGFHYPPTDHYLRPYWIAVESSAVHRLSSSLCFGNTPKHIFQLNYARDFVKQYSTTNQPFFGFSFFVELSHDYMSRVSAADDDFQMWLRDLHSSGYFNQTFLFFLSDHGHRFDAMRATLVGRIEERMPFFAMNVPPSFKRRYPHLIKIIKNNLHRLTSPYDIHSTLLHILRLGGVVAHPNRTSSLGRSLFEPISPNRTCGLVGIPEHYCTCEEEISIDPNDSRSVEAAKVVVGHINDILAADNVTSSKCSRLALSTVKRTDLIVPNKKVVRNARVYFGRLIEDGRASGMISKLRTVITTIPGGAMFEATLVCREDFHLLAVSGDVSRINPYGPQSWCVDNPVVKKFCFCGKMGSGGNGK